MNMTVLICSIWKKNQSNIQKSINLPTNQQAIKSKYNNEWGKVKKNFGKNQSNIQSINLPTNQSTRYQIKILKWMR